MLGQAAEGRGGRLERARGPSSSTGRPRRGSSRCPGWAWAAARGSRRRSSTSTRPAACARTATAASCCPAPGASISIWEARHRGHRGWAARAARTSPSSIPTAPTTRPTPPSRASPSSSPRVWPRPSAASQGRSADWEVTPAGGIVAHTPDNYPVCDWVLPNAYAIVDSGHGFKMLALGRLAADDVLDGEPGPRSLPPRAASPAATPTSPRRGRTPGPSARSSSPRR